MGLALASGACVDGSPTFDTNDGSSSGASSSTGPIVEDVTGPPPPPETTGTTSPGTTTVATTPVDTTATEGSSTGVPGCEGDCPEHPLDVVFVIDNSATMGNPQRRLALAAEALLDQLALLEASHGVVLDLHLMVTTTDFGNPLCTPFQPAGYEPARGAPIYTPCTDRLQDFTSITGSSTVPEACTDACPLGLGPTDPYVAVVGGEDNVPAGTALQVLQCLLPQGINGCGFESSLENMLQALNPSAAWNAGPAPFLRSGADLAIVLLTDEGDCSVQDYSVMEDPAFMNVNPDTGAPQATSAVCWNAGVSCDGPDGMGVYTNCVSNGTQGLQPTSRYIDYLLGELVGSQGKDVMMLTIVGVPGVVQHSLEPPFEPTVGGVADLVIHDWVDGPIPGGEITPDEWAMGVTAADKTFALGIGPGCTGLSMGGPITQGQPPPRIREVCEALDEQGGVHCCMESVCDDDLGPSMTCLRGMIETAI